MEVALCRVGVACVRPLHGGDGFRCLGRKPDRLSPSNNDVVVGVVVPPGRSMLLNSWVMFFGPKSSSWCRVGRWHPLQHHFPLLGSRLEVIDHVCAYLELVVHDITVGRCPQTDNVGGMVRWLV